jgi:hypothetical protein
MRLTNTASQIRLVKKLAFYTGLCAVIFFQGCSRQMKDMTQFRSHKVTVSRHGLTSSSYIEDLGDSKPSYHYSGYSFGSGRYEVVIKNDEELTVNGKVYGQLNGGDSVNIDDRGVTVNSMSNVETAKYLQTNSEQARP